MLLKPGADTVPQLDATGDSALRSAGCLLPIALASPG